jgi:hypothetical protein
MPTTQKDHPSEDDGLTPFERFEALGRKLFGVPKSEVDALREQEGTERSGVQKRSGDTKRAPD